MGLLFNGDLMPRPTLALALAALLCGSGSAFLFASAAPVFDQIVAVLATGLANAVFAALAIAVSAMTVLAASLVATDLRSDFETARAWHGANSQAVLDDSPSDVGATEVDWPYTLRPQDESGRRIFLAHRLAMPERYPGERCQASIAAKEAAEPPATDAASIPLACPPVADAQPLAASTVGRGPTLVADNPRRPIRTGTSGIQGRLSLRGAKDRLVANGGRWLACDLRETRSAAIAGHPATVIVLADVSRRGDQPRGLDITPGSSAPSETTCRGPPSLGGRVVGRAESPPGQHHNIKVVDNFGAPVPIVVAELDVIETFLGDVLGDIVAITGAAKDRQTT